MMREATLLTFDLEGGLVCVEWPLSIDSPLARFGGVI